MTTARFINNQPQNAAFHIWHLEMLKRVPEPHVKAKQGLFAGKRRSPSGKSATNTSNIKTRASEQHATDDERVGIYDLASKLQLWSGRTKVFNARSFDPRSLIAINQAFMS